jgi:glycosyltransferase involved in cell wall biosynthesis
MKIFYTSLISGIILISSAFFIGQESDLKIKILMFIFPLIGFFIAPLYPMLNSKFLGNYPEKKISRMVSFIILFTSLGGSIGSISTAYIFQELSNKLIKINNGIKVENFYYKEKDSVLKNKLALKDEDIVAIYVSRLSSVKNHKFLLDLMSKINMKNFKLLIVGEGEEKESLLSLREKLQLEDRVIFQGFVKNEELVDFYSLANMVLFPSSSEGFGISMVEAIACRKALVLFENIYFEELEDSVLRAKNEEEFIEHTKKLINSEEFRQTLGLKGEKIREKLSIENCAKNYEKLYRSLL